MFFCHVFLTSFLITFSSQSIHAHQSEAHLGTKLMTFPVNVKKWQLRFRSREDIQNQAFQGLHFRIFCILLIRVVKTCDCHPSSKALFTLCSIYGPIWRPIWDPSLQYVALHFSNYFFTKYSLTSEISSRHLRHKGGKGGTGRHLVGIWEASGTPGGHGAPGGSES